MSCVVLTNVVGRSAPFQRTTELLTPLTKLVPFTVSVKAGPPATALLGERVVNVGVARDRKGQSIGRRSAGVFHRDRCGARRRDVSRRDRGGELGRAHECSEAISSVPAHHRPLTKLLPFTVSVKAGPPATALLGESVVNVGVEALVS